MRVAALYDVHGNLPALEAVLADVEREGADVVVVGGDMVSGPMPSKTLERLRALGDRARFLRGNADRHVLESIEGPASDDPIDRFGHWAAQQLGDEQRAFLRQLPLTQVVDVDGLGAVLFCHATPYDDEEIFTRLTPDDRMRRILAGVREQVVVCGHTHMQVDRTVDGIRVVNAGSVGLPYEGRRGAYWALLGPDVELRRTEYDLERAADAIRATGADDMQFTEHLLEPPSPDDVSEFFERKARGDAA